MFKKSISFLLIFGLVGGYFLLPFNIKRANAADINMGIIGTGPVGNFKNGFPAVKFESINFLTLIKQKLNIAKKADKEGNFEFMETTYTGLRKGQITKLSKNDGDRLADILETSTSKIVQQLREGNVFIGDARNEPAQIGMFIAMLLLIAWMAYTTSLP